MNQNFSSVFPLLSCSHLAMKQALTYLKKILTASSFTYSMGFYDWSILAKDKGVKLNTQTVTHPVARLTEIGYLV